MSAGPVVCIVLGTRPELVKLAPVIRACERRGVDYSLVHTGQHYSRALDGVFFDDLSIPEPDHHLGVGSGSHAEQTGEMIEAVEAVVADEDPEIVVVQGDTNSSLAGGVVASKLPTTLAHVEAGLRSYDREMPEEVNRVLVDHVADSLLAPTERARENLRAEGLPDERIVVTGNTVVDAVREHARVAADRSTVLDDVGVEAGEFLLLTAHRQENVDDPDRFGRLLEGVARYADRVGLPVVYPVHPRAAERIESSGVDVPDAIRTVEPLRYLDFLRLEDDAALVFTDSGGVQEEACVLGTPCVTLRDSTERPETVTVGANRVAGVDPESVVAAAEAMCDRPGDWENPFGDGDAADRVLDALVGSRSESDREVTT
ncbi:non-hydrolyzing UDP-N-acetylglucosamine 2-epimerase [Candidatus Halobonum tyrrellensis]|uniref:UDP-N-acetylglucosamine 2-epimerase n=1 Tax=Candidatus Halobonum tyrrellensis G22 TaxID=1324957 RepID=V4H893_9EURY|nr:UDP-N-acetylglucosamine 2-epimerase (non-hydrolyzing) [Candidatus Halobonum tyrrellensis]ESP86900.1 UDP-N-acetylglucosamine 2-epimerase [Candidatus Halobonum tyrrellensis G22]